ncbi:GNAT family N-acetyltransferase [Paraliomyxa miuraensis]|uniref:GNAT family N-acetyltransferase n=1 Tax=Paraliomyxa miuraensis TaxID=376150 RepID=UPI002258AC23|nr:GNAT family N-acetyltransferase [Paraliomyxa miuraensis]MCX4247958.1 GNAT family N-acetyltransferase [Paraliomyxa miuraensis]
METSSQPKVEVALRQAGPEDAAQLLPWMRDFNASEGIVVDEHAHARALDRLLCEPILGRVWILEHEREPVGYAVVTFNFDLELPGLDAFLTELYVVPEHRHRGIARRALVMIEAEAAVLEVMRLQLEVRSDNDPARHLYGGLGYHQSTRLLMGKRLGSSGATTPPSG